MDLERFPTPCMVAATQMGLLVAIANVCLRVTRSPKAQFRWPHMALPWVQVDIFLPELLDEVKRVLRTRPTF